MANKIEILAPAGSWESMTAGINSGADAVYFGIGNLNMRSRSSVNFVSDDLSEISNITKSHNIKSYLTVNTVIYDFEIDMMKKIVTKAKDTGIDAIIATDHAVISYANQIGIPIHISTQLNISNIDSVKFFSKFADVMVLARELSLEQVAEIIKKIENENITGPSGNLVKIEIFAHGALCMAISGKCYLSLHEWNKSANRGACLQKCRRSYVVSDKDNGMELEIDNEYIMSPKDLKTIHFLNKIVDAGVGVIKIEGRGRSADYVTKTVKAYKEALLSIENETYTEEKIKVWEKELASVFNRGFWDGYYLGQKLGEWTDKYGSQATVRKIQIGKITNYYSNINVAEFLVQSESVRKGDKLLITGPTTGAIEITADEIIVDEVPAFIVQKGEKFSLKIKQKLRRSDKFYKLVEINGL